MDKEDIIFFELWNEKGDIISRSGRLDLLPEEFILNPQKNFKAGGFRNAYRTNSQGSVRIVIDEKNKLFQGIASIQRACVIYLSFIPKLKQIQMSQRQSFDAIIRRFSHNLIKFQKRFKDNFSRLISDKSRARSYADFKNEVEKRIKGNTSVAADDVCQMSHRAIDLDAQIETLRIIGGYADNTGTLLSTDIKKAMYRLTNPFLDELSKRKIDISIDIENITSANNKVSVVHSLFNAAIWQLLDNASKYVLSNSIIEITADLNSKPKKVMIKMISICIDEDEYEEIFKETYQGRHVKKNEETGIGKDGNGIGMFIVRKALGFMKSKINVVNLGFVKEENGYKYCTHVFTLEFNG